MAPAPRRLIVLIAVVPLLGAGAARAQALKPLSFVEAVSMPAVQDPQLSPDGRQILYVLDSADWKNNRRAGHIYRINADGTGQVQLTFGERGESS